MCNSSIHRTPNFMEQINSPTLLTYFKTLPTWCQKNNLVTNCFYAMEYHQTKTSIRDKELALNLTAGLLRPIGKRLMNCLKEAASAHKVQMTAELGKQMMTDLKFYPLEITEIGELSSDEERDKQGLALLRLAKRNAGKNVNSDSEDDGEY